MERRNEIAGCTDTGLLKWIALICMIIDHTGIRFCSNMPEMRIIGRIAFPIYAWCIAVGITKTRSIPKYALRLALLAVVSQPLFMIAMHHTWELGNVFFTLLLGLLAIWGIRENKWGSRWWAPAAAILVTCLWSMDYGWKGVFVIIMFYLCRSSRGAIAAALIGFCLYWGTGSAPISSLFGVQFSRFPVLKAITALPFVSPLLRIQSLAVLSLPFILWQKKGRTPFPKLAAYAMYPGHLFIIWLVQVFLGRLTVQQAISTIFPFLK